jgi:hypothetical protein
MSKLLLNLYILYTYVPAIASTGSEMWPPGFELDIIRLRSGIRTWKKKCFLVEMQIHAYGQSVYNPLSKLFYVYL